MYCTQSQTSHNTMRFVAIASLWMAARVQAHESAISMQWASVLAAKRGGLVGHQRRLEDHGNDDLFSEDDLANYDQCVMDWKAFAGASQKLNRTMYEIEDYQWGELAICLCTDQDESCQMAKSCFADGKSLNNGTSFQMLVDGCSEAKGTLVVYNSSSNCFGSGTYSFVNRAKCYPPKEEAPTCDPQIDGRLLLRGYSDEESGCFANVTANGVAIEGFDFEEIRADASYDECISAIEAMQATYPNVSLTLSNLNDAFDLAKREASCTSPGVFNCAMDTKAIRGGLYLDNAAAACQEAGGVFVLANINMTCTVHTTSAYQYLQNVPECLANPMIEPNCTVAAFKRWLTDIYSREYRDCVATVTADVPEDQGDRDQSSSSLAMKEIGGFYLVFLWTLAAMYHF
jgi:hypothetical protein